MSKTIDLTEEFRKYCEGRHETANNPKWLREVTVRSVEVVPRQQTFHQPLIPLKTFTQTLVNDTPVEQVQEFVMSGEAENIFTSSTTTAITWGKELEEIEADFDFTFFAGEKDKYSTSFVRPFSLSSTSSQTSTVKKTWQFKSPANMTPVRIPPHSKFVATVTLYGFDVQTEVDLEVELCSESNVFQVDGFIARNIGDISDDYYYDKPEELSKGFSPWILMFKGAGTVHASVVFNVVMTDNIFPL